MELVGFSLVQEQLLNMVVRETLGGILRQPVP